ncbi:FHA domain-containing protein [bacterium]|nr:FHA domain-containing protein [bacterium]
MNPTCCQASASDHQNSYCNDCGKPLIRCAAFEVCGGLLDEDGKCSTCFSPKLVLRGGQARQATVGDMITLPLQLSNEGSVKMKLHLKGVWFRKGHEDWKQCHLAWDRIEPHSQQPIDLMIDQLQLAGNHRVEVVIALASRSKLREEVFAFSAGVEVLVEGAKELVVQQNINYGAEAAKTGGTIYAPIRISKDNQDATDGSSNVPKELPLVRARVYERSFGWRGTRIEDGQSSKKHRLVSIRRNAIIRFKGFSERDTPHDSPLISGNGTLTFGRARTKMQGDSPQTQLLAYQNDGKVDEKISLGISKEHFRLWIENGRLMLRDVSTLGTLVNSTLLRGDTIELTNGSVISPLKSHPRKLQLKVVFEMEHDEVSEIQINRV